MSSPQKSSQKWQISGPACRAPNSEEQRRDHPTALPKWRSQISGQWYHCMEEITDITEYLLKAQFPSSFKQILCQPRTKEEARLVASSTIAWKKSPTLQQTSSRYSSPAVSNRSCGQPRTPLATAHSGPSLTLQYRQLAEGDDAFPA